MSGVQQREAIREKMFGQGEVEKEDEGSVGSTANTEERLIKGRICIDVAEKSQLRSHIHSLVCFPCISLFAFAYCGTVKVQKLSF